MESSFVAKYLAEKTLLGSFGDGTDRISKTLLNSKISLNPHQIKASLFAFSSPVSKGVMLCDEVGLGKTIEAGIVISQYWFEHKRNILIITPASLTRQWASELLDKFGLDAEVIDRKSYNSLIKRGVLNPFEQKNKILIMSYNFASSYFEEIRKSKIDLVVIDEAHKLRNVYNPNNIIANNIYNGIANFKKVLLTATPLQNNLMELYGLSMLIDGNIFGDKEYFKKHFIVDYDYNKEELRERLSTFIHRTLRNQVQKYVKYSKRITKTFTFIPSQEEDEMYDCITELIQSNPTFGLNSTQTMFVALILRKLLSSSTSAVKKTLKTIKKRLESILKGEEVKEFNISEDFDEEFGEEVLEEPKEYDLRKITKELFLVDKALSLADKITDDKKAFKLLEAINYLFENAKNGRSKKILIFTESRETQNYLFKFLSENGFGNIVLFNGGSSDSKTKEIYEEWISREEHSHLRTNSKSTNVRSAILDYFKDNAEIMISTEAGAEGLNMQFCSMLVNYDLPWNPQRVEQRIGRCHRFGQKNDVIVINFLNENNQIDSRIYELLDNKFKLFDDVFGSSDEILGTLDNESNFEREIFKIYMQCRTPEEIDRAFNQLQERFKVDISSEMKRTREILIDNFDEDLQNLFESLLSETEGKLKDLEVQLWRMCQFALKDCAVFDNYKFNLKKPYKGYFGNYCVADKDRSLVNLRIDDGLGREVVQECKNVETSKSAIFDISNYKYNITDIKSLKGQKGYIILSKLVIDSFEKEESIILSGRMEDGKYLDSEICEKLFRVSSIDSDEDINISNEIIQRCQEDIKAQSDAVVNLSMERNNSILNQEIKRIDDWANDKISGIELKVENLREARKNLQKEYDYSTNSEEKISIQADIEKISKTIKKLWLELADNEDIVERERKIVVDKLKAESMKSTKLKPIFVMPFKVV